MTTIESNASNWLQKIICPICNQYGRLRKSYNVNQCRCVNCGSILTIKYLSKAEAQDIIVDKDKAAPAVLGIINALLRGYKQQIVMLEKIKADLAA